MATAKKAGQELAKPALKSGGNVIHRAAVVGTVRVLAAGLDSQGGLGIDGSHTEEGNDPHPENGPRAAGQDGAGCAHNVARAHLGGDGGSQRLEGTHSMLLPSAPKGQIAKYLFHALPKSSGPVQPVLIEYHNPTR